ncbi:MAG TPA: SDR family NAD(P)-dependent oxidoreductase [Chitinophagaceae bacterium]|nr:SDR family NAD(P)-dependent oxidoreductase [Chitinophagaceae bacterium]
MLNSRFTVITGASEGFGKALALECASRNMDLVLVALPGSGLPQLATFIKKNFAVSVFSFEHDLSSAEECVSFCGKLAAAAIRVNMLINNAGMGGTHYFEERGLPYYHKQISLNIAAPTFISYLLLDNLKANSPSHILNVSSLASFFNLPKKQVYAGTKSFLVSFSKSLRRELKERNVNVSTVCPGGMNTTPALILQNRTGSWISRLSVMDPAQVARITIDQLLRKKELIIPGRLNKLFLLLDRVMPKFLKNKITDREMKHRKMYYSPVQMIQPEMKRAG